jgi:hypothetical protein
MNDHSIVNIEHCQKMVQVGIKGKVCENDYIIAIIELVKNFGPTIVFGKELISIIPFYIWSIKFNAAGTNSFNKA